MCKYSVNDNTWEKLLNSSTVSSQDTYSDHSRVLEPAHSFIRDRQKCIVNMLDMIKEDTVLDCETNKLVLFVKHVPSD